MTEEVLVCPATLLPDLPTTGLVFNLDLLPRALAAAEFLPRDKAEGDPTFKQLIPYSLLRCGDAVFRYRRSGWGNERRLHGQYSLGIGGHVNRSDVLPLWTDVTPIVEWARDRELREEFDIDGLSAPRLVCLLNDDSTEVGRVHLGVIYEYWLAQPVVRPREKRQHIQLGFATLAELAQRKSEFEGWSQLIIDDYLAR